MEKIYYSCENFKRDIQDLKRALDNQLFDAVVAVARGGLTTAHSLAVALEIREIFLINAISYEESRKLDTLVVKNIPNLADFKRVLIVDDIADSGDTLCEVLKLLQKSYPTIEFKTATLFYKPTAKLLPDYSLQEAKGWIEFFWESFD
jgi:xanthine phosphoribosyltransferase